MKIPFDQELLERYQNGTCTSQEQAMIDAWYLQVLSQGARPSDTLLDRTKEQIWQQVKPSKPKKFRIWISIPIAAMVAFTAYIFIANPAPTSQVSHAAISEAEKEVIKASAIENTMIKLEDGSFVILEKGSKLLIAANFNQTQREVFLVGKAFFDVAHNPKKPFIIYSKNLKTSVLGTAFDISALPSSKTVKVNVIRGSVEVTDMVSKQSKKLVKNMQAVYQEEAKTFESSKVNASKELSWNKQDLEFNDIALQDATQRLEEQFGYKISVKKESLNQATFTYSMRAKESMESFIKSICVFIGATYNIDHQTKTITIDQ